MGISLSTFKSQIELDLISKVEPVIESLNYSLRDLEVVGKGRPTIRIILDKKDDQKIGIDDCSYVHEKISPMFDLWDPFPGAYTLEISSPGEHAPLRTRQHFEEALGSKIRFETTQAIELPPPRKARKARSKKIKKKSRCLIAPSPKSASCWPNLASKPMAENTTKKLRRK
jgi:ribosome maturation factor RimP